MRFKTRNTYKRHLRTRHGKELVADGIRLMPHKQFLLVRTKPYLHDDQQTDADDVLQSLLSQSRNLVVDGEALVDAPEDLLQPQQQQQSDAFPIYEAVPATDGDDNATVVKLEPM